MSRQRRDDGAPVVIRVEGWEQYSWLRHGFSSRAGGASSMYAGGGGGELNLGFTAEDDAENVRSNRRLFARAVGQESEMSLVTVRQVHGTDLQVVRTSGAELTGADGRAVIAADGLLTDVGGVLLGIQVADCVPVLVADVRRRVVGSFHAGWRGTAAGVVGVGIERMRREYGCAVEDLVAAVGPAIGACCYAVGDEVRKEFGREFGYAEELFEARGKELYLDLADANRRQMVERGLGEEAITMLGECTACARVAGRRKYFSHRAEHGFTGRGMGMIGIGRESGAP